MKKVVVLGGGIAGTKAAILLADKGFDVKLISDRDYIFIYPISIWIYVEKIKFPNVKISLQEIAKKRNFLFQKEKVKKITPKTVFLENGEEIKDFDYLIIAIGQQKLKHKGIEHTLSVCGSPEEILQIKERLDRLIQNRKGKIAFGFGGNPKAPESVRGGPVFEVMFNVHNYLKRLGIRENFELTFFAPMEKPGARLGEKALTMIHKMLQNMSINKITGKKIKEFKKNGILFEDGTFISSDLTLFTPAGEGHSAIKNSDLPKTETGFLKIEPTCQVYGIENIYGIGDVCSIEGPPWRAKQGHLAEVMGKIVAHNIAVKERLKSGKLKTYTEHINIMCLMDTGNGGAFAYRSDKKAMLLPLPIIGHWMKKAWGVYYRLNKLGKVPKII